MPSLYEIITNPALLGFSGVAVGALAGFFGARTSKPHEVQTAANAAVHEAIEGFKAQLADARAEVREARAQVEALTEHMTVQSETIERLNAHIRELNIHIDDLRRSLDGQCPDNGCPLHPRPSRVLRDGDDQPILI